jgi:hypothetical protein
MLIKLVLIIYFTLILVFTYLDGPDSEGKNLLKQGWKSGAGRVVPN